MGLGGDLEGEDSQVLSGSARGSPFLAFQVSNL